MTIEIHELIIQARVEDQGDRQPRPVQIPNVQVRLHQDALIESITQRVLERLRDAREDWR